MTAIATNTVVTPIPAQLAEIIGLNNTSEVDLFFIKNTINRCFNIIMNILHNPAYQLEDSDLSQMSSVFENTSIYITDSPAKTLTVPIFDKKNNLLSYVETINLSQVIDYFPVNTNEITIEPITVLIIPQKYNLWVIVHELCHLLSTGQYYQIDNKHILHRSGINTFFYAIKNDQLLLKNTKGHNGINELITDYITWHLLCVFYQQRIPTIYNGIDNFHSYIKKRCNDSIAIEQFIGWYFSGKTKKIHDLLTKHQKISFENLHKTLNINTNKT